MKRIITLLVAACIIPLSAHGDTCDGMTEEQCLTHINYLNTERESRLEMYNPTNTWQRAPYGKKFTYDMYSEGLDDAAEAEMIRREDERNGL